MKPEDVIAFLIEKNLVSFNASNMWSGPALISPLPPHFLAVQVNKGETRYGTNTPLRGTPVRISLLVYSKKVGPLASYSDSLISALENHQGRVGSAQVSVIRLQNVPNWFFDSELQVFTQPIDFTTLIL